MSLLTELQTWYEAQCDGDWEHEFGIQIDTLANPGWITRIDLEGSDLENRVFQEIEDFETEHTWMRCWIEDKTFHGVGDPKQLENILQIFLNWTKADQ